LGSTLPGSGLNLGNYSPGQELEVMAFAKEGRLVGCDAIDQFA
jgi:hypothetical protein